MLKPRFFFHCSNADCCVYVGGTEVLDIYMGECHERPWDPAVILVGDDDYYDFTSQEEFAKELKEKEFWGPETREELGRALAFVQCFFPTPERWTLNELAKANT